MPPPGIAVILAFIAGLSAAPDGTDELIQNKTVIDGNLNTLYEDIIRVVDISNVPGFKENSESEFRDIVVKALNGTKPTIQNLKGLQDILKQIRNVQTEGHETDNGLVDGKKRVLDRGFVSDLIGSTLSGVQMGLSLGNKNGTANQLCIKLGNISMGGCQRTAGQNGTLSSNNTTEIPLDISTDIGNDYALYEFSVKELGQGQIINDLENQLDIDVWVNALPGRPGMVLVPKDRRLSVEEALRSNGVEFNVKTENVKKLLDLEDRLLDEAAKTSYNASRTSGLPFDRIYTYEEVDAYLEMLAEEFPETVTLVNAGQSFEGRDIKYIKISTTNFQDTSKPIVFMESLLHAREWVTLPATLYAIHKLVIDVTENDLLQDIDWIILPVANPDGYVHTHEDNRFWRKNRATGYMIGDVCSGVDLNRNFDVDWSEASSGVVCMENFHGRAPFSEPETAAIRDIFNEYASRIELFLDIHSFGSMILYGYGTGVLPPNGLFLHFLGVQMAQAIDGVKMSWNPDYVVGNVALVLYEASGSAQDYAKAVGVPFSYTFELPGRRFGVGAFGFLVDPSFIEQAGFETWEGIKVGARYVRDNYRARL